MPSRRRFFASLGAAFAGAAFLRRLAAPPAAAAATGDAPVDGRRDESREERYLELYNTHSRETVRQVYKRGDAYDPAALAAFRRITRDRRNGEMLDMDPQLFDQLFDLARAAQVEPHYEIISAYRSPESNGQMAARPGSGVSKNSLHMQGRAIDVRLRRCSSARLRDLAIAAKRGGVGFYEKSDFVHLDTGRFRTWTG